VAKQISVSDEVYGILMKAKGSKSFSEAIKEMVKGRNNLDDVMEFFGMLKKGNSMSRLEKLIEAERKGSLGRNAEW
jgi:predicted CopG family antitoxin